MTHLRFFTLSLVATVAVACASSSSSTPTVGNTSCPKVGDRTCPKNSPFTQAEVDACNRCLDKYQAQLACDPTGGYTCVDGMEQTSKDLTCKAQADAFESCFIAATHP